MKVWITKYALTKGVIPMNATALPSNLEYVTGNLENGAEMFLLLNRDCFESREDAIRKAEHMRYAKIHSLKKQIDKLNKMEF